jgi:peptidoglycan/LPS O-acetylase OafA/YrhL
MQAPVPQSDNAFSKIRTYRPFIDGLRAVAILTVVGSHLYVPGLNGGYIGVDVFFVISGYLIINQIIEDIRQDQFNLFDFFARRAFRILPAFLFVMVCCAALATTIFVQPGIKEFAASFLYAAIMLANHFFLSHQGYFDMAAFTKPLLHMWSLAVEEQFYIVAPLILVGLSAAARWMRSGRANKLWVIVVASLGIVSFAGCVIFTLPPGRPNYSFYLMPLRGWEFILGGVVPAAAEKFRKSPTWAVDCLALFGAALIIIAVLCFDERTTYPSYRAVLPAAGTMSLLVSGLIRAENIIARILATAPMVGIGIISYSWYLWHWPLISFTRTLNFGEPNFIEEASAGFLSVILAALTYRHIESPMRRLRQKLNVPAFWLAASGATSCLLIGVLGYLWSLHVAPLLLPTVTGLEQAKIGDQDYPAILHHGILLGDSHANHITEPLRQFALREGSSVSVIAKNACLPLLLTGQRDDHGFCDSVYGQIKFKNAEFLIVVARWNFYLGLPSSDPFDPSDSLVSRPPSTGFQNPYEVLENGLEATIEEAIRSGVSRILIIAPPPEFPWYAPYCVMRSIRVGSDFCVIPRLKVDDRRKGTMIVLQHISDRHKEVRIIDPLDLFCTAGECRPNDGRKLYFSDTNHLSQAGIDYLEKVFKSEFLWALTGSSNQGG